MTVDVFGQVRKTLLDMINVFVGEPGHWPNEAEVRVEDLVHDTNLTSKEAIVVVGDQMGLTDKDIQSRLFWEGGGNINRVRPQVREKRRMVNDEEREKTKEVLDEWSEWGSENE